MKLLPVAISTVLTLLVTSVPCRADVLPVDDCLTGAAGDPCSNAGSTGSGKGVCTETMCPHESAPGTCDAGSSDATAPCQKPYACLLCLAPDGGVTTGSGSGTAKGSGSGSSPTKAGPGKSSGSGSGSGKTTGSGSGTSGSSSSCAATPAGAGGAGGALFLGLGAVALMVSRRRRQG